MGLLREHTLALLTLLALLVGSCDRERAFSPGSAPKMQGGAVGNGGNYLTALFEETRVFAAQILYRMRPDNFPPALKPYLTEGERHWLFTHRLELADDISRSPHLSPVDWAGAVDVSCAYTQPTPLAPIGFLTKCAETVGHNRHAAAVVLIHESVHHLRGSEETPAYRIATAVGLWWIYQGHPNAPHWSEVEPDNAGYRLFFRGLGHSAWTGEKLILWRGSEIHYFEPSTEHWKNLTAENDYLTWFNDKVFDPDNETDQNHRPMFEDDRGEWVAGKLVVYTSCYEHQRTQGVGHVYDPKTNRWQMIPAGAGAPSSRKGFALLRVGEELLIWGGRACLKKKPPESAPNYPREYDHFNDGALYNPRTGRWTPVLPTGEIPAVRMNPAVAWSGDKIFLWGGSGSYPRSQLRSGAVYDLHQKTWTPLPEKGAPPANYQSTGVWAGDRFFVISPEFDGNRKGAMYFPETNTWKELPSENTPTLKLFNIEPFGMVWTGSEVILVLGKQVAFYSPDSNTWQTYDKLLFPSVELSLEYQNHYKVYWTGHPMEAHWSGTSLLRWEYQANALFILHP